MHIELSINIGLAEVDKADLNFVTELGGLFFGGRDTSFVAFGEFDFFFWITGAAGWWTEECAEGFDEPSLVDADTGEETFAAGFDFLDPFIGSLVPIISNWASKNLDPKFFRIIWIELGECTSDTGKWI